MKTFALKALLPLSVGLVSGSILSVIFPWFPIFPVFVFAFAIAISLTRGFLAGLPLIVALGLVADVATLGRIGLLSGFSVGLAYTASFFSKRFIVEHSALALFFSGLLSGVAAVCFPVFSDVFLFGFGTFVERLSDAFSFSRLFVSTVVGVGSFSVAVISVRKLDEWLLRVDPHAVFRS